MQKNIIILLAVLSLGSCAVIGSFFTGTSGAGTASGAPSAGASSAGGASVNYWVTPPETSSLVIIGVSGRQSRRDAEIEVARQDAARKASIFHGVYATFEMEQNTGSSFFDSSASSRITIDYDDQLEKYMDKLTFDPQSDIVDTGNTVFIRFRYPAVFPGKISYSFGKNSNGNPEWTTRQPGEINGFPAGVGFARRQQRVNDTISRSYENAIVNIISASSVITTSQVATNSRGETYILQKSEGRLENFVILETWIEPETQSVWTLVVAQNID
jgi:hypothetical protein